MRLSGDLRQIEQEQFVVLPAIPILPSVDEQGYPHKEIVIMIILLSL